MLLWAHECHVYTLWNYNIYNAFTHCGHCVKPYCEPCVVFNPHCAGNNAPGGGGWAGTRPHPPPPTISNFFHSADTSCEH